MGGILRFHGDSLLHQDTLAENRYRFALTFGMIKDGLPPFHLSIPVRDLAEARNFYGSLLGCPEGRSSDVWVDFNFFGHQLVCHQTEGARRSEASNPVDGHDVPVPHFGAVLEIPE